MGEGLHNHKCNIRINIEKKELRKKKHRFDYIRTLFKNFFMWELSNTIVKT